MTLAPGLHRTYLDLESESSSLYLEPVCYAALEMDYEMAGHFYDGSYNLNRDWFIKHHWPSQFCRFFERQKRQKMANFRQLFISLVFPIKLNFDFYRIKFPYLSLIGFNSNYLNIAAYLWTLPLFVGDTTATNENFPLVRSFVFPT